MPAARRRARARLTAGSALAGLLLLATAQTAAAHDELVGSDPAPDAALDAAPGEVRLDFSADVLTFGAAVVVADAAGGTWQAGEPVLDGSSVSVPLEPLPDGAYEVRWRVVSSDGHPITGLVPFTVGDVAPAAPGGASAPAEAPGSGTPTAPAAPGAAPSTPATPSADTSGDGVAGAPAWRTPVVAGGGAVLAGGVYALVLAIRGRRPSGATR